MAPVHTTALRRHPDQGSAVVFPPSFASYAVWKGRSAACPRQRVQLDPLPWERRARTHLTNVRERALQVVLLARSGAALLQLARELGLREGLSGGGTVAWTEIVARAFVAVGRPVVRAVRRSERAGRPLARAGQERARRLGAASRSLADKTMLALLPPGARALRDEGYELGNVDASWEWVEVAGGEPAAPVRAGRVPP